jgi:hypothetical protein
MYPGPLYTEVTLSSEAATGVLAATARTRELNGVGPGLGFQLSPETEPPENASKPGLSEVAGSGSAPKSGTVRAGVGGAGTGPQRGARRRGMFDDHCCCDTAGATIEIVGDSCNNSGHGVASIAAFTAWAACVAACLVQRSCK